MLARALARGGAIDPSRRRRPLLPAAGLALAGAAALGLAACGGPPRQDVDEREGTFPVEIERAEFPKEQKLAKRSRMVITVRNVGRETIPNAAINIRSFEYKKEPDKAEDPRTPIFVVNGEPAGDPKSAETAYPEIWALGALAPGKTKTWEWDLTAVEPMPYDIRYRVLAGLDPQAKAVLPNGQPPVGRFRGEISTKVPEAKVAESGEDIISSGERIEPRSP